MQKHSLFTRSLSILFIVSALLTIQYSHAETSADLALEAMPETEQQKAVESEITQNKQAKSHIQSNTELLALRHTDWYVNANLGLATTFVDNDEINGRLTNQGLAGSASSKNSIRLGMRLNLGWQWHPNWSVELGYVDLGKASFGLSGTGAISDEQFEAIRVGSGSGPELALMGRRGISDTQWIYGRAGVWSWQEDYSFGPAVDTTLKGTDPLIGIGTQWIINPDRPNLRATFGWDGYRVDKDINHFVSLGLQYRFGHKSSATPLANHVSELPIKQELDVQAVLQALQSQLIFPSNESDINIESQQIANLADWLKDNPEATLKITGHTDNSGTEGLNKTLSYQRGESLAKALQIQGVEEQQLIIDSAAASLPIADNASPEGRSINRRVELMLLNTNAQEAEKANPSEVHESALTNDDK